MVDMDPKSVLDAARAEVEQENFRIAVDAEKRRLRTQQSWWDKLFPFTIKIERKDNV